MSRSRKFKKQKKEKVEIWTEEKYEEHIAGLYEMEYIAGFTDGGIPYGVFRKDLERGCETEFKDSSEFDDEVPF